MAIACLNFSVANQSRHQKTLKGIVMNKILLFTLAVMVLLGGAKTGYAQVSENSDIYKEIMALDNRLFEEGFNQCKPKVFETLTDEKLEFFHDKGGTQNRDEFLEATKRNICASFDQKPMRTLVAGSTTVYTLENNGVLYGAIQQGEHQFHTKGTDPSIAGYTVAKFTHVWLLGDGKWKLKTALSFDHQQKAGKAK
ncbi:MAG: nuclear transport factor 2 family protein [Rhodanobacteraceae bacterium]|nr:nuclear transport factor 2 family protein [Rhodanobacteraceae bacterium]